MTSTTQDFTQQTDQPAFPPGLLAYGNFIERFRARYLNWPAMAESHRKDIDALLQANRDAYDGFHAIVERRNALLLEELAQWTEIINGLTGPQAIAQRAEIGQKSLARAMQGIRELIELEGSVRNRTWKVLQDRVQERVTHLQGSLQQSEAPQQSQTSQTSQKS
ncbi:hypothetical protein [Caballeronia sp. GAFFF1]|uniref:hypothetical protein n=1 Tax=Caballeronia sp. GAFFF1 TaxID=2921779 RepID=UPI002028A5F4|nr:hypothetical protein [Caballeronia sp. GAFFF1]